VGLPRLETAHVSTSRRRRTAFPPGETRALANVDGGAAVPIPRPARRTTQRSHHLGMRVNESGQRVDELGHRAPRWCLEARLSHKPPGEAAGSFLRVGSKIGHRVRHETRVRPEVVRPSRSGGHLRDRAAAFSRRLCATASTTNERGSSTSAHYRNARFAEARAAVRGTPASRPTQASGAPTEDASIHANAGLLARAT
jgi:hypothetical protein